MTEAQATRALALLRAVASDIESMRGGDDDSFTGFGICWFTPHDDMPVVEWPNLSITGRDIAAFLASLKGPSQ